MSARATFFSEEDVRATYRFLAHEGRGVTEVRVIAPKRGIVGIGYFDNEEAFTRSCDKANGTGNVYVGIQPRPAHFLEQASNKIARLRKGAKDDDIEQFVSIVIDIDPERPKHTAASDDELAKAIDRGEQISKWAVEQGYLEPRLNMSGNGCQLWFAVPPQEITDLNRAGVTLQLKAFEAGIRAKFNGDGVAIDSIYNLSRIIKVIGTRSIKGKASKQHPHRLSASLRNFARSEDAALLESIKALPTEPGPREAKSSVRPAELNVAEGLSDRVLNILSTSTRLTALFEGRGKTALGADGNRVDPSSSGYDFSLLLALTAKDVTDPSELATVLWHRPDGRAREKGQSYVKRTVEKVLLRANAGASPSHQEAKSSSGEQEDRLSAIVITDRELRDVTRDGLEALMRANEPPVVFQHGTLLVRIQESDIGVRLDPFSLSSMRGRLGRVSNWHKEVVQRDGSIRLVSVSPPLDAVHDLLSLPAWPFPPIEGVVECPVFAPSGDLVTTPGYHAKAKLWMALDPELSIPDVSPAPSKRDLERARALLWNDLLAEFPFVDDASRAHAVAGLLLPFVRPMIVGPTPLHLIDAPAPGTGKSLLGDAMCLPATGRPALVMTEGRDDEEWRKRLTAAMISGPVFMMLDNLRRRLDSSQLAAAITATTWTDRILGKSATTVLPVKNVWMATGNNVTMSNEMTRRCVWIRLDAKVDQPWMRTGFRHPDLRTWAKQNRGELIWAALTFVQAWIAAERPTAGGHLGNFEAWAKTLAGILEVAGVSGFLDNAQDLYARGDEETAEWREFVGQWWERFRDKQVQTQELFQIATDNDLLGNILGDKSERSQKTRLGRALGKMRDRVVGDHRIEAGGSDRSSRKIYRLQSADGPSTLTTLSLFSEPGDTPEEEQAATETTVAAERELLEI